MNILYIYKKYQIMPNLQLHQLRVAAVASLICKSLKNKNLVEEEEIVKACLLHDMGNILKFDLTFFPEFTQPEGLEYWQQVKEKFKKFGENEHFATQNIIKELGQSENVLENSNKTGFSKAINVLESKNLSWMICNYADMRVGPYGVFSLRERTEDGKKRHERNNSAGKSVTNFDKIIVAAEEIEQIVFNNCSILPTQISNETVNAEIENLKQNNLC